MAESNYWGGRNTNDKYIMMMDGNTPIAKPVELLAHTFTNFARQQIDRVTGITVRRRRGKIVKEQVVLSPAIPTGVTFTVGMGSEGEIYTPLLRRIARGNCNIDIYVKRNCPDNPEFEHFWAILESVFNPPTFVNDLIVNEGTAVITQQAEALSPTFLLSHAVGAFRIADLTPPLYAIAPLTVDCADCDAGDFDSFVGVGGAGGGSDVAYVAITNNRFGSVTTPTTGIANGNTVTSVYTSGDVILIGFADDPDPATAETGGTAFSSDRGVTWALDSDLSHPIFAVGFFDGQYLAAGGVGGATPEIYTSDDGVAWTAVSSGLLTGTVTVMALAVDPQHETLYAVGLGALALKGTKSGGAINFAAMTPAGVSGADLFAVAVYGSDHIALGGEAGYYGESLDGGATWSQPSVPGSGAVKGIAGASKLRYFVGGTTVLTERSVLTNNAFVPKTPQAGISITGNITAIASLPGEHEYFVVVTDAGEVFLTRSFEPGS